MSKQLMEVVLPRLARPLYHQLKRYQSGQMDDDQFTEGFESLLRRLHSWLARHGVSETHAALAIHGAVLILSGPGLRAEAIESQLPLEVIEYRAIREAAEDVAANYSLNENKAVQIIASLVARYAD
ncbi:MAG TPA: hypothetical protein VGY77_10320 [Gemmataceae bacterium]|jgi:hypothetical protein|nr:hypothetical protein [Gemmataceae bacterium]